MKMLKLALLTTLTAAALPAMAAEYVLGVDYQPCQEELRQGRMINYHECTIPSAKSTYSDVYIDNNGVQRVAEVSGIYLVHCSETQKCAITRSPTHPDGEYRGDAPAGNYALTYNFYIGTDAAGRPVAYAKGRGPKFGEEPFGSEWDLEHNPVAPWTPETDAKPAPATTFKFEYKG
ncbi:hypothetical protein ACFPU0_22780 [Pseudomonas sp. GCM10022186]|uniref:hypothetical protein n=1 Tax=Pseudomonas sp. GCM10022186 TaxID=3252650 RepID=UPI00361A7AE4